MSQQWVTPCRNHDDPVWYSPTSLANVFEIFQTFEFQKLKLVCGNTGTGESGNDVFTCQIFN